MSKEQMREEFENEFFKAVGDICPEKTQAELLARDEEGNYISKAASAAWWGWWNSRAALVVELPEPVLIPSVEDEDEMDIEEFEKLEAIAGAQYRMQAKCRRVLEAAGVTVK